MPSKIILTDKQKDILRKCYRDKKMSLEDISGQSKALFRTYICSGTIRKLLSENNISIRSWSESKCQLDNLNKTYLDEEMIEWIDGFLLGDGAIHFKRKRIIKSGKIIGCKFIMTSVQKEWTQYAMSKFFMYGENEIKPIDRRYEKNCPNIFWRSNTLSHPDINFQMARWYGQNDGLKKQVPRDVRITPTSLMLWYLGDGNLYIDKKHNTPLITLCTDSFSKKEIFDVLVPKLNKIGIVCSIAKITKRGSKDKFRIKIFGRTAIRFLDFIGGSSPIKCYAYKFEYPKWMGMTRLKDIGFGSKEMARAYYYLQKDRQYYKKNSFYGNWVFTKSQTSKLKRQVGILV